MNSVAGKHESLQEARQAPLSSQESKGSQYSKGPESHSSGSERSSGRVKMLEKWRLTQQSQAHHAEVVLTSKKSILLLISIQLCCKASLGNKITAAMVKIYMYSPMAY